MNLSAEELNAQILMLPEHEQQKVFDFVLAQQKNQVRKQLKPNITKPQTEGERVLVILESAGLLGCMEGGDGKLSENYKEHLWGSE